MLWLLVLLLTPLARADQVEFVWNRDNDWFGVFSVVFGCL